MWKSYQEKTQNKAHSQLLEDALRYASPGVALDLGAGGLRDTKYLVRRGFQVDAVDSTFVSRPNIKSVFYFPKQFHTFRFHRNRYDVSNFQYALPFTKKGTFDDVWKKLTLSTKGGGIIVGQLFGTKDEWNTPSSLMTFHTKKQVLKLLAPFEVLYLKEEKKRRMTLEGKKKHWHVFHIIARKKILNPTQVYRTKKRYLHS